MNPSPFDLNNDSGYRQWRERKLAQYPTTAEALLVEIADPRRLAAAERAAILERCTNYNMAIYVSRVGGDRDKEIVRSVGKQLGLTRLDHNLGADEDAVTSLTVQSDALHKGYIPYTNRPLAWHTDGYYNTPDERIRGMVLHCVQPAEQGGESAVMDHEIAYILLRDRSPAYVEALMHPQAMVIPANRLDDVVLRPERSGPVFLVDETGNLYMRYTDRRRNVVWRNDETTTEAVGVLRELFDKAKEWQFSLRLESGWGLVCNNVLHKRNGFEDGPDQRLVYRARYYDRIVSS